MRQRLIQLTRVVLIALIGLSLAAGSLQARRAEARHPVRSAPVLAPSACGRDRLLPGGAIYRICMPAGTWNGDLVLYAHGYVAYNEPLAIPEDQLRLPDGTYVPDLVNSFGFAFATTSYRTNGLAVAHGVDDLVELEARFTQVHGAPNHVYLTGVSEGGLITVLAVEQRPDVFDGGLAACGPIGDFRGQLDYLGDFRVLFDYFFPGLLPGDPTRIPQSLIDTWDTHYETVVKPVIMNPANAGKMEQLFLTSHAPRDAIDPASVITSTFDALSYNILATNDAIAKLGGQPFDNQARVYSGSDDDDLLNASVQRFGADPAALEEIDAVYQTSGRLSVPLITLHTTLDQQVPYWHESAYRVKVILNDSVALYQSITVDRYGHCAFSGNELLDAFLQLVSMVLDPPAAYPSPRLYLPLVGRGS